MTTFITVPEVAKRLNISRRAAYYLISNGDIPSIKLGPQTTRVDEQDLNNYIETRKRQNATIS